MPPRLLSLCVATLVGVLTGCSFLGGNRQQRVATPVSRGSAQATATAQLAAANEHLQESLDRLRTSVALLPDRDALGVRVAAIEASLRRVEAGGATARAAATAHRCRNVVAQVEVVRGAVDAAHAGLAGLERSFAATGTLAS